MVFFYYYFIGLYNESNECVNIILSENTKSSKIGHIPVMGASSNIGESFETIAAHFLLKPQEKRGPTVENPREKSFSRVVIFIPSACLLAFDARSHFLTGRNAVLTTLFWKYAWPDDDDPKRGIL